MTKEELWKVIESQSWDDKAETILKNAVEAYLSSMINSGSVCPDCAEGGDPFEPDEQLS